MKSQFKRADASGARFALVFGEDELAQNSVTVKPLREALQEQTRQPLDSLESWAGTLQSKA
jgi:histidyl-tRNA synthetase